MTEKRMRLVAYIAEVEVTIRLDRQVLVPAEASDDEIEELLKADLVDCPPALDGELSACDALDLPGDRWAVDCWAGGLVDPKEYSGIRRQG